MLIRRSCAVKDTLLYCPGYINISYQKKKEEEKSNEGNVSNIKEEETLLIIKKLLIVVNRYNNLDYSLFLRILHYWILRSYTTCCFPV